MPLHVSHIHTAFTPLYDEMEKHAGIGTWIYDRVSGICSFSRNFCRIAGMSKEHPFFYFNDLAANVHPGDRHLLKQTADSLLAGEPIPECEYRVSHGARVRYIRQYGKTLRMKDGEQTDFGFWQDITRWRIKDDHVLNLAQAETELRQKNRELRMRNAELQAFSFIASHDFKEPIARIYTAVELLLTRGGQSMENDRKNLRQAQGALQRMRLVADDIAQFYRADNTQSSLNLVDLNRVVTLALKRLEAQLKRTEAVINVSKLPYYHGYFSMLTKLFQYIIEKFIATGNEHGAIVVGIEYAVISGQHLQHENILPEADYLELRFSVNRKYLAVLPEWEEFALCEKIATMHGGFIAEECAADGRTVIRCYLQRELSQQGDHPVHQDPMPQ